MFSIFGSKKNISVGKKNLFTDMGISRNGWSSSAWHRWIDRVSFDRYHWKNSWGKGA